MLKLFAPLYLLLALTLFGLESFFTVVVDSVANGSREEDARADFEGGFFMVEQLLASNDEQDWPRLLEQMSSRNIPVQVRSIEQLELTENQLDALMKHDIVVLVERDEVLRKMANSHQVISFGPVTTVEALDNGQTLAVLLFFLLLVILIGLWALDVYRRVRHLQSAYQSFGEGQLDIRARQGGWVEIGHLNRDFNAMADRIQRLIESHKMLVNAVSHELRTPIARIRFELEHAGYLDNTEDMQRSFDSIAEDTVELEKMVSELLIYARYEREQLDLPLCQTDIAAWLQQWQQQFRSDRACLGIALELIVPAASKAVAINQQAMQRALDNLVTNGMRYAASKVQVSAMIHRQQCCLIVDDDGPGIAPEHYYSLFQPFVRGDNSRNRETGGHGLGLAIVKQIVERHKGTVTISKSPLGGARFTMAWPTSDGTAD